MTTDEIWTRIHQLLEELDPTGEEAIALFVAGSMPPGADNEIANWHRRMGLEPPQPIDPHRILALLEERKKRHQQSGED